ncbi:hypothetical protein ACLWBD_08180 [Bdellovibrio sp. HCB117]|uniref:hypothetical protein n=1 Tax=Bdellovibrio TaxID=958 RepID=UPI000A74F14E|nr:hypothetical protein [Bdellovibrio bacteriovorus]
MRFLLFVLSLAATPMALAVQPIEGTVYRDSKGVYLSAYSDDNCKLYTIETKSEDAALSVRKLSNGDTVTASGLIDSKSCMAIIESVDYVGLKKLLGYWYSQEGIITVRDYNSLSFYPINMNDFQNGKDFTQIDPITYRYSVTPSDGKEWVLFLSDSTSTVFATILFNKNNATMRIYDSENGEIIKVLRLSKWGNLK